MTIHIVNKLPYSLRSQGIWGQTKNFAYFFLLFVRKREKSIFPTAFGVRSLATPLVKTKTNVLVGALVGGIKKILV